MSLNTSVPTNINDTYAVPSLPVENISNKEDKANKGIANGYAPLDGTGKVPEVNLPDTASLDAEVDGKITTHNSATTSVHGIADTAELATKTYADDAVFEHKEETTSIHGIVNTGELIHSDAIGPNTDKIVTFNESGGSGNTVVVSGITNAGDGWISGVMGWGNPAGTQWSDLNGTYVKTSVAVTPSPYNNLGMHTPVAGTFNYYLQNPISMGSPNSAYNGIAYFLAPNNRSGWGQDPDDNGPTDPPVNYWRLCVLADYPYTYFTNPSTDAQNFPTTGWVPVSLSAPNGNEGAGPNGADYLANYGGGFSVSVGGGDNSEIGAWGFGVANGNGEDAYIEPTGLIVEGSGRSVLVAKDRVELDNGAKLRKGTTDALNGGYKGIALECSAQYELKWEAGRLYTLQQDGFTIRSVEHCVSVPTATDDDEKGYVVGTRWVMDSGATYVCTDATEATAVWELKFSQENGQGTAGYINTSGDASGNAGGYIDTSATNGLAGGGYINTTGADGTGGFIDTRGLNNGHSGGSINTSAGDEGSGGSINTSGGSEGDGGSINTSNGGGSINTMGGDAGSGGSINTSAGDSDGGGSINTSGGEGGVGGSINTSDGGGSINTRGVGSIQLGLAGTRTTLNGSASGTDKTITLPNATGTIALTNDSRFTDTRTPTSHTHGNITNGGQIPTGDGQKTITLISGGTGYSSGSALINGIAVSILATSGVITSVTAQGSFSAVGAGTYAIFQSGNTSANVILNNVFAGNLPLITTTNGLITTGSFGTTANSFCQGNDSRLQNILNFRNYSFSPTGATTADVWQATYTIPANAMGPNGKIEGVVWASCSASAFAKRIRLYITNVNPNNAIPTSNFTRFTSLSTAPSSIASTTVSVMRQFIIINRNSTNSQIAQPANSGGVASTTSADAFEELNYDTTQPIYIVVALQKDGTGDAYTLKAVNISVVYSA